MRCGDDDMPPSARQALPGNSAVGRTNPFIDLNRRVNRPHHRTPADGFGSTSYSLSASSRSH